LNFHIACSSVSREIRLPVSFAKEVSLATAMHNTNTAPRIIGGVEYEINHASGDYSQAHLATPKQRYKVPWVVATAETLEGYGRLVKNFDEEKVAIVTWPAPGWRPVAPGTGNEGGITKGDFIHAWKGDLCTAQNTAVKRRYITGRLPEGEDHARRTCVLVREANYHPDGGQVFVATKSRPSVVLLAKAGDDVKPEDFRAFYFDGNFGCHIAPGTWHKPAYPIDDELLVWDKQGAVHAVICVDIFNEFGVYLDVPLVPR